MAKSQLRQYVFNATLGQIEVPGKIDLQQLLVITDTTKNVILYNFADPSYLGTSVSFIRANDTNFITALDNTDGNTIIQLNAATISSISSSGITSSDTIQIFYESPFQYVRSPEIGTDAFERQRVASPQSLLDADFEYGMQPTKWLTISQQRGIPSIYEVPGTDITVTNATTDASTQSGGSATAESIITITTAANHNYSAGQAITIKGFNSAITGFDRAEGSFFVYTILSATQFTFIAKGKVGFSNGDSIYTPFIQLRAAGFYSGSNINAVLNCTVTSTNGTGNVVTVTSTTGMTVGSPFTVNQVITNAVSTNNSTNYITVGSTIGMYPNMPLLFSGTSFGGLTSGTIYYIQAQTSTTGIIDTKTITVVTTSNGSTNPVLTTITGGNMNITGGASFGGLVAGTQYYIASIPSSTTLTLSNNINYTATVTATNAINNSVTFTTTNNMVIGEAISLTGSTFGNLQVATYYVYQIIDSRNAILSTSATLSPMIQTTATGSMTASIGTTVTLTAGVTNGYLFGVAISNPTYTVSTPITSSSFTASISGTTMTVTQVQSGTLAPGQGIALSSNNTVPSLTAILSQLTGTTGAAGTYQLNTSSSIGSSATFISTNGFSTITVNTGNAPHGLLPGSTLLTYVTSDNGTNNHLLLTGPYFVESVSTNSIAGQVIANQLTYTARSPGFIQTGTAITALLYARADSFYTHRPFDGGVSLGTSLPSHGAQAIRMSKKYIRYQSGKSINFNTGLLMAPNYDVRSVVASSANVGATITITTDDVDHGAQVGATITLTGVITSGYNGSYTVSNIVDERTLTVIATQALGAAGSATITDPCFLSISNWYGASVRSGTYDEQNGVFFQYDGNIISVVKRSSTFQIAGAINVVVGSGQIIGVNSRFSTQLSAGDRIVIRGMTHIVTQIVNDTLMYVNPQYRGYASISGIKASKTIDYVVPQSKWNVDRCDGSNGPFNPSGYQIIPIKMQMVAVQWTWYGAGFIDWMLRGPEGKYITVHRLRNNNVNNEAWMRSGNLPVRYEVVNESARSTIVGSSTVGVSDPVISVLDTTFFPNPANGYPVTLYVDNEFLTYTSKINAYVTASAATNGSYSNTVTVSNTTNMAVGQQIVFTNISNGSPLGNILSGTTYWIYQILQSGANGLIQLSTQSNLATVMTQVAATVNAGSMTTTAFTGLSRGTTIQPWATGGYRTFQAGAAATHTVGTGIMLVNGSASPIVSHWGAAFIEDGGFDSDRSYIFNYQVTNVLVSSKKTTAFAVRLAPSVSNALTGDLGGRELINRASFLLNALESSSGAGGTNAALVIEGIINPSNMPALTNITFNSLSSLANPTGQPSFSQVAPGSSMVFANSNTTILSVPVAIQAGATLIPLTANASSAGAQVGDDIFFTNNTGSLYGLTKIASFNNSTATFTGAITAGSGVTFTASIVGGIMTVTTAPGSGTIVPGMILSGTGINAGSYIVSNISGTGTSVNSTWQVSSAQTIQSVAATGTLYTLTVNAVASGIITSGMILSGGNAGVNQYITIQLTSTFTGNALGNIGTYAVNIATTFASQSTTGTLTGIVANQLTYAAIQNGTVQLTRGTYALPGETVFSYINSPANKDSLDLTSFKELTNTPIGGRGCYPNGCDILFVNAYITQGSPINQNLVLRWGEAQA